eukprot:2512812-Pleurochrysis_carterae.AAC.1
MVVVVVVVVVVVMMRSCVVCTVVWLRRALRCSPTQWRTVRPRVLPRRWSNGGSGGGGRGVFEE